jgi:hypothetical protein
MTAAHDMHPVPPDELAEAMAHGLRFDGRKRVHQADEIMARVMAERLARAMERAGLVVLKKPPLGPLRAP